MRVRRNASAQIDLHGPVQGLEFLNVILEHSEEPRFAGGRGVLSIKGEVERGIATGRAHLAVGKTQARFAKVDLTGHLRAAVRVVRWDLEGNALEFSGSRVELTDVAAAGTVDREWRPDWDSLSGVPLGRHHFSLLSLPLAAAFIGALLGGLAIRLGWTRTAGLALIVPSLMVIPGPHLINAILDLVDNYVPMCVARLGLATGIIVASALGIVAGVQLTLSIPPGPQQSAAAANLNVVSDMLLAGIVTCGFAMFYNANWTHIGMATLGGMAGHGLRFLALASGWNAQSATFVGGLAVGVVSAWIAKTYKAPFAVIAFAGAVTMIPGVQIYRALAGSLQLVRLQREAQLSTIAATLADTFQSGLVVGALALGLVIANRAVLLVAGDENAAANLKQRTR